MLGDVFKTVTAVGIACLLGFMFLTNRSAVYEAVGVDLVEKRPPATVQSQRAAAQPRSVKPKTISSGGRVIIPKSPRDGQFWTYGAVNNRKVNFLVDTGASSVALTPKDAKASGINPRTLNYDVRISTANGEGRAARVTLKSLKIGSIRVRNVDAIVVEQGLGVSLLGMTYLGEIKKIEVTADSMILRN